VPYFTLTFLPASQSVSSCSPHRLVYPNGISDEVKKKVTDKLEELKKVKESQNIEDIKKKLEEMNAVVQEIGQELYKQAQAKQEAQAKTEGDAKKDEDKKDASSEASAKEEEPVEADFEDSNKKEEPKAEKTK